MLQATATALRAHRATGDAYAVVRRYHPAFPVRFEALRYDHNFYFNLRNFDTVYRIIG